MRRFLTRGKEGDTDHKKFLEFVDSQPELILLELFPLLDQRYPTGTIVLKNSFINNDNGVYPLLPA